MHLTATPINEPHQRAYLFTHPQTSSNLITKILNLDKQDVLPQSSNHTILSNSQPDNFFRAPTRKATSLHLYTKPISTWTDAEVSMLSDCYQECFFGFQHWIAKSEASGRKVIVKEHAIFLTEPHHQAQFLAEKKLSELHCRSQKSFWMSLDKSPLNKTILTDEFLLSFQPTFLVRHPALAFPSYFRAHIDASGHPGNERETRELETQLDGIMTFHWLRCLYDFYTSATAQPIVLESDDVSTKPEVVKRYAELVGLDPTKLRWEWGSASEDDFERLAEWTGRRIISTISSSSEFVKDQTSQGLSIEEERLKWNQEFGAFWGWKMAGWVKEAMPDYEFLKERRLD